MSETSETPSDQFRAFLVKTLATKDKTAVKIDAIVIEFDEWMTAHQAGDTVEVIGGRVVVETIEVHGLRIGLDAIGNATQVEAPAGTEFAWSL
jgi:hypothetical protein